MATFGTTDIPSASVSVRSGGTIAVSAAFATTEGLVGGMDTENGSATPGETVRVESSADAVDLFGEDSELKTAVDHALNNGAVTVYACPVTETETTETFDSTTSGTLEETPFDPNVHVSHTIEATDTTDSTEVNTEIVYDSPPTAPEEGVAVNPVTGEFEAASSSSYDITYSHGDYATAIQEVAKRVPRTLSVGTESTETANTLLTEMSTYAQDFDFMHGFVGAPPEVTPTDYEHTFDDRRLSVVAPSRAYIDDAGTDMARTVFAVAGRQAGKELGESITYDNLNGLVDLHSNYGNSELGTLADNGVLPLKKDGQVKVIKDMTTSTDAKFERIYASEVTDEAAEISHEISQGFVGEPNTESNRFALGESHASSYSEMEEDDLLDAYQINVAEGADPNTVDVDVSLDIVDVMDTIAVDITVGDIIEFGGAS